MALPAYRRPGVQLTQQFVGLSPALAVFALPNVHVGPAFQVVPSDQVGTYAGLEVSVTYASQISGTIIDTRPSNPSDLLNYPVTINLENLVVQWLDSVSTGVVNSDNLGVLNDPTANVFATVQKLDNIVVTAPAPLVGTYAVIAVLDNNDLQVNIPFAEAYSGITYSIQRNIAGPVNIPTSTPGVAVTAATVTLPPGIMYIDSESVSHDIITSQIVLTYRAQRFELSTTVTEFTSTTALLAQFGLNQVVPQNPAVFSVFLGLENTATACNLLELPSSYLMEDDEVLAHTQAQTVLSSSNMYAINVVSQNLTVIQLYNSFVNSQSTSTAKKWCVAIVNRTLLTIESLTSSATTTDDTSNIVAGAANGEVTGYSFSTLVTPTPNGFAGVKVGDVVPITGGTNSIPGTYNVTGVNSSTSLTLNADFATGDSTDITYGEITREDGITPDGIQLNDQNATFITSGVVPGMFLEITGGTGIPVGRYKIGPVNSQTQLQLVNAIPGIAVQSTTFTDVTYYIDYNLSLDQQANFIGTYAQSIGNRRIILVWPDICVVSVSNVNVNVPGFFLGSAVAALTTGLPSQQGFTNLSLTGYVGVLNSSIYFSDDQLDVIASGGVMIVAQTVLNQTVPYIRHQLTTDRSSILFQEYSVTKNVDFISYFIVVNSSQYTGKYNIYEGLFDDVKLNAQKIITFLRDKTIQPFIGGVILSGSLTSLVQDPVNIDEVDQVYGFNIPIPLNNLNITLIVSG